MVRTKKASAKSVSIEDVARVSGLSITTVSRVINKFSTVKQENRDKILEAIKKLKFKPSLLAQRLASGKSNVVALVIPRYEGIFYSFYALELLRGIGTLCSALKLDLLLHLTDNSPSLNLKGAGGIIFADIIGNRFQLEEALGEGVPCVVINNLAEDLKVNSIAIDNAGGAQAAVDYLASLGHRRIAHIAGDLNTQAAAQRFEGYKAGLLKNNLQLNPGYVVNTDYSRGEARSAAEQLIKMDNPPSAVFVASDSMALEVMAVAREQGRVVPRDLSIIGFDDNPSGLYGPVALTTLRQPLVRMGQEGVKRLNLLMNPASIDNLKKETEIEKIILPVELVIRDSCSAPR